MPRGVNPTLGAKIPVKAGIFLFTGFLCYNDIEISLYDLSVI